MGSVPNCQKEIPNRYGIRWFKCKLKPPKNEKNLDIFTILNEVWAVPEVCQLVVSFHFDCTLR